LRIAAGQVLVVHVGPALAQDLHGQLAALQGSLLVWPPDQNAPTW